MSAQELRIYHRLQLAAQEAKKAADEALRDTGLTTAQTAVLAVVSGQSVTQREVATQLGLTEGAITAMVNRLSKLGYLSRQRDSTDARLRLLQVSQAGQEALTIARTRFELVNKAIDAAFSPEELIDLTDTLVRMRGALQSISIQDPPGT